MSDEWSKPVKDECGRWVAVFGGESVTLEDGVIAASQFDTGFASAPRDVVLRLLAAEASDRLGWDWRPYRMPPVGPLHMSTAAGEWWFDDGTSGDGTPVESPPTFRFHALPGDGGGLVFLTPDELLAAMHGRFLLADALREAGQ